MIIRMPYIKQNNWMIVAILLVIYVVFAPYIAAGDTGVSVTESKTIGAQSIWNQITTTRQLWGPTFDSAGLCLIMPVLARPLFQRLNDYFVSTGQWIAVMLKHTLLAPIKFTSNYVISRV